MYMRFVTTLLHEDSHRNQGVFSAAYSVLDSGSLDQDEWSRLREILIWLNKNLPTPPESFSANRAVFWFKSSAKQSIRRIWELVHLLRHHGYHVEIHKCRRLGNICYDDELQVAAYPSERDGRVTIQ
jgi:hypothetical protein